MKAIASSYSQKGPWSEIEVSEELLRAIIDLDLCCLKEHGWSNAAWRSFVADHNGILFVFWDFKQELHGFALLLLSQEEALAHLLKVAIRPDLQNQGYGYQLIQECGTYLWKAGFKKYYLEVAINNMPARSLYNRLGFSELVVKKNFYQDGQAAIAMIREGAWFG